MSTFTDYWGENWPALLPAITFLLVNPWSIAALLRSASARRERLKVAHEDLVDQIEAALISGSHISRRSIHRLADAIADRRQVKFEELHYPVVTFKQATRRLQRNPALNESQRNGLQDHVDALIAEVKSTDGVAMIVALDQELARPPRDYQAKQRVVRLIGNLAQFAGYEDETVLRPLTDLSPSRLRNSLSNADFRQNARNLLGYLQQQWSGVPTPAATGRHDHAPQVPPHLEYPPPVRPELVEGPTRWGES